MRTTVRLPDDLYAEVRRQALAHDMTVTSVMEAALREKLERWATRGTTTFEIRTFRGDGVMPGVDLHNSAALLDVMDGLDGRS